MAFGKPAASAAPAAAATPAAAVASAEAAPAAAPVEPIPPTPAAVVEERMAEPAADSGGSFSLADLLDLDVSDIEEVRFVDFPVAIFDFEITGADVFEEDKDEGKRFRAEFTLLVLDCLAVIAPAIPGEDLPTRESLLGKVHTEKYYVNSWDTEADVLKAIGRIRAFVTDVGLDSRGKLGPMVRNTKGHKFRAQTTKQRDKNDATRWYTRLKLTAPK